MMYQRRAYELNHYQESSFIQLDIDDVIKGHINRPQVKILSHPLFTTLHPSQ